MKFLLTTAATLIISVVGALAQGIPKPIDSDTTDVATFCPREQSLLLYVDTSPSYSLLTIESILKSLEDAQTQTHIFCQVENLNRLVTDDNAALDLRKILIDLDVQEESIRTSSDIYESLRTSVENKIRSNKNLVRVSIYSIQDILEYQFIFYDNLPATNSYMGPILTNENASPTRQISVFVDLRSSSHELDLINAIKRLIPRSNAPPLLKLSMNMMRDGVLTPLDQLSWKGKYIYTEGDTLILDASETIDPDTPYEQLQFTWRDVSKDINETERLRISPFESSQKLSFHSLREHNIELTISDGIDVTSRRISLVGIKRPSFFIARRSKTLFSKSSLFELFPKVDMSTSILSYTGRVKETQGHHTVLSLTGSPALDLDRLSPKYSNTSVDILNDLSYRQLILQADTVTAKALLALMQAQDSRRLSTLDADLSFSTTYDQILSDDLLFEKSLGYFVESGDSVSVLRISGDALPGKYIFESTVHDSRE